MTTEQSPKVFRLGESAVVIDCTNFFPEVSRLTIQRKIWWLAERCRQTDDFIDIVPGMNNLTLFMKSTNRINYWLAQLGDFWLQAKQMNLSGRNVEIPIVYGGEFGPDLEQVARYHQLSCEEVIRRHSSGSYTVLFLGFQPGFPYLDGLDSNLFTPRLSVPRISIPAGSVGIGGNQTGIYPASAPGGWQLIGRTNMPLFTPQSPGSPTLVTPGDTVQFIPVASLEFDAE
ncbi:5-oxoprolinase subunit PxpB [Shewanella atlantica]|uniref:5-oxoprolinase subunit PxpB n=1 Tax=Shewanella atlantica TaxID=271099 RepID=A0A3S0KCE0_9GAMM|nr:5-oxoprolinase subunit PxpB [Shewanella atlantica]RTR27445.1 5-oxoprolinase subunit PxpB [Shewanella atlantica]